MKLTAERLAGFERREVRSEFERAAPAGWTSGDAAGLPMFPALVRYDECQRGMVEHALRLVVAKTRKRIHLSGEALCLHHSGDFGQTIRRWVSGCA